MHLLRVTPLRSLSKRTGSLWNLARKLTSYALPCVPRCTKERSSFGIGSRTASRSARHIAADMKPIGYSRIQIGLHWIAAALIVAQFVLHDPIVAAWDAIPKGEIPEISLLVWFHVIGGSVILALAIWHLALRIKRGVPALPERERGASAQGAGASDTLVALRADVHLAGYRLGHMVRRKRDCRFHSHRAETAAPFVGTSAFRCGTVSAIRLANISDQPDAVS